MKLSSLTTAATFNKIYHNDTLLYCILSF